MTLSDVPRSHFNFNEFGFWIITRNVFKLALSNYTYLQVIISMDYMDYKLEQTKTTCK